MRLSFKCAYTLLVFFYCVGDVYMGGVVHWFTSCWCNC